VHTIGCMGIWEKAPRIFNILKLFFIHNLHPFKIQEMIWSIIWYVGILCAILKLIRWVLIKWRGTLDRKNEINVKGKIVIVTGASSGIGLATATELASRDANVIMACRDLDKTKIAIKNIRDKTSRGQLVSHQLRMDHAF
jgi:hypothetical protein